MDEMLSMGYEKPLYVWMSNWLRATDICESSIRDERGLVNQGLIGW